MFFTQEDYRKIEKWLLANSRKDTEFAGAATPLKGNETVVLVQNGKNVKASVKDVVEQLFLLGVSDFVNITDKYNESYISLPQAIELIPYRSRKIGQVITFLDDRGRWSIYQFQGLRKNQWNMLSLWVNLMDLMEGITIIDSEDIVTEVNSANQTSLKFADKTYNEADFSGLGRVYLRKNIVDVEDPVTGNMVTMNWLNQSMISKENTIYIVQYSYSLNRQTISIPEGSVLLFEGGSINDGTVNCNGTTIVGKFGGSATIAGTYSFQDAQADEEDITQNQSSVLKFKDKEYDEAKFSGLGRTYLRKNIVNGVNILTQNMINNPNTIYHIQYDYNLSGKTITVPSGCVLLFEGGSISNGTLKGNGTNIISVDNSKIIFGENIIITGMWNIPEIYDSWFTFDATPNKVNNQLITNILSLSDDNVNNTIHFEADRTYYFELPYKGRANLGDDVRPNYSLLYTEAYSFLRIFYLKSNTRLIINNELRMLPTNQGAYIIFWVSGKDNIVIEGTGAVYGDAHDHLYTDLFAGTLYYGEYGLIFRFEECKNIVIRDITLSDAFGDCLSFSTKIYSETKVGSYNENITVDNAKIKYARRNGISGTAYNWSIINCFFEGNGIEEIRGTAPKAAIDFESDYLKINPDVVCKNVVMSNCKFTNNEFDVSSTNATLEAATDYAVSINNCVFTAPLRINQTYWIKFSNCVIPYLTNVGNSVDYFTASSHLRYENCQFEELNQAIVNSAFINNNELINCTSPQNEEGGIVFMPNLGSTRVWKISIPKKGDEQAVIDLSIFTRSASRKSQLKATLHLGNNDNTYVSDFEVFYTKSSTPSSAIYGNLPILSNIVFNSEDKQYDIYLAKGSTLSESADSAIDSTLVYYKVQMLPVTFISGESTQGTPISGGSYSELLKPTVTMMNLSEIPPAVVFPKDRIFKVVRTVGELPTDMLPRETGSYKYIVGSRMPAYWDTATSSWRSSDGYRAFNRRILSSSIEDIEATLTVADAGISFYVTDWQDVIYWNGSQFINMDGTTIKAVLIV